MSYDLCFYRKADDGPAKKSLLGALMGPRAGKLSSPDENELLSYMKAYGHFSNVTKTGKGFDATYFNQNTGASAFFTFDRSEAGRRNDYPGFAYTGLDLNINYFRPFFYGYEAALAAEAIGKKFDLYIADPEYETPKACTVEAIFSVWDRGNTSGVRGQIERLKKEGKENAESSPDLWARMPRTMSVAWWSFRYNNEKISRYVQENNIDAFVPTFVFVYKRLRDNRLVTCIPFTRDVGYVLPRCDVFGVDDNGKKGMIEAEVVLDRIRRVLKPLPMPGMDLQYFTHEDAKSIGEVLYDLKPESEDENYKPVPIYEKSAFVPGPFIDID